MKTKEEREARKHLRKWAKSIYKKYMHPHRFKRLLVAIRIPEEATGATELEQEKTQIFGLRIIKPFLWFLPKTLIVQKQIIPLDAWVGKSCYWEPLDILSNGSVKVLEKITEEDIENEVKAKLDSRREDYYIKKKEREHLQENFRHLKNLIDQKQLLDD